MRERERNTNRGRQDRRGSNRKRAEQKRRKRIVISVVLCVCVLGILVLTASLFFSSRDNSDKDSAISGKTTTESEVTLQTVDKEKLTSLINDTEQIDRSVYTEESVAVLDQNIEKAKSVMAGNASQSDLDDCYRDVTTAILGLEKADASVQSTTESSSSTESSDSTGISSIGIQ